VTAPAASAVVLPPEDTSPGAARQILRRALRQAGLEAVLDEALLLVTELVTNAVVHAGTALELRIDTGEAGLRVDVLDASPGASPVVKGSPEAAREGGRGLFLLDALADEWGTTHTRTGKSVWFRLGAPDSAVTPPPGPAGVLAEPVESAGPAALSWLLALPEDLEQRLSPEQLLGELLHRLADALAVPQAALVAESIEDPGTWLVVASRGQEPSPHDVEALRRWAQSGQGPVLRDGASVLLPVRGRGGVLGALMIAVPDLDPASLSVARLANERLAMVMRDERAEVAQRRQRGSLALLAEASDMFAATLDVALAVSLTGQLVVPRLARWAAVYTMGDHGIELAAVSHEHEAGVASLREALSGAAGSVLAERLASDLAAQRPVLVGRSELAAAVGDAGLGDVLALPLVARRRLLGGLVVARGAGERYSAEDVSLLLDLARRAALAVDNARLYGERTAIAHALQASLLPPALPSAGPVDFGARYLPAGEGNEVGGDFYDVFALPDGAWGVAIGDVCGKGAEAAAITGLARNVLRLLLREGRSPSEALRRLNDAVLELGEGGRFCTVAVAVVRPSEQVPGGLDLCFSSAGHPPPAVLPLLGPPSFAGGTGTLLGVVADVDLEDEELFLPPGDALVFYTDGVTERRRGARMFGDETLLAALGRAAGRSADAIAGLLEREVREFAPDTSRDDLAVLVVRAAGPAAELRHG
jgi:serine phosphatase RsbU (regulator of sigma subunit)/anti-sigma regulatory factor (Ser/Thr protein kinase)